MINEGVKHVRTLEEQRAYRRRVLRRNIIGTALAASPFIGFICFKLIPMMFSLVISLYMLFYVGMGNYQNY